MLRIWKKCLERFVSQHNTYAPDKTVAKHIIFLKIHQNMRIEKAIKRYAVHNDIL